jgi:dTDP-4-dehydrorhamnose reductase
MDILLLGGAGQLGRELLSLGAARAMRMVAPGRDRLDLTSRAQIAEWLAAAPWSAVINAAAYTAVDAAERDRAAAFAVNATAPAQLAAETGRRGVPLIHISTDYVFDGRKGRPYAPDDAVNPINVYGASKLAGEEAVRAGNPRHVVVRTSWLYSPAGANFVTTMLRLARERERLRVVDDQRGCPTAARDLAAACLTLATRLAENPAGAPYGVYHYAGAGETTWCGFARAIFELGRAHGLNAPEVVAIGAAEYPTAAARPSDTRLDCAAIVERWGVSLRDWRTALADTLARLLENKEIA